MYIEETRSACERRTGTLTRAAALTVCALTAFAVESLLPPLTPIPGIKLGLANIFTLLALRILGAKWAALMLTARILLGSALSGQGMSFLYSAAGGAAAFSVMAPLATRFPDKQIWVVSIFGSLCHIGGQMAAAIAVTHTPQLLAYLPILLFSAIVTGAFTGLCAQYTWKRIKGRKKSAD